MSACKDCGHPIRIHRPVGFCTGNSQSYDQCGCDTIPDGTWVTEGSLARALREVLRQTEQVGLGDEHARAIMKALDK